MCYVERADQVVRSTQSALTTLERMRFKMAIPTQSRLRELFNYDPEEGVLIWRDRPRESFATAPAFASFNKRCRGRVAGHIEHQGYRVIVVDRTGHKAHRLIWLFVLGEWVKYPEFEIDHVNGNRSDNRIQNLRKATKSMNQRNGSMRSNNSSGVIGVNWVTSKQRWIARIWDGPKHRYLGAFVDLAEAAEARARAEREIGYHPGHGKERAAMGRHLRPLDTGKRGN